MKQLNVGIVGMGQLGSLLARRLYEESQSEDCPLKLVATCDVKGSQFNSLSGVKGYDNYEAVTRAPGVDVVVEAIGGAGSAFEVARDALDHGKHLVTANSTLAAGHLQDMANMARGKNVQLRLDGSVMGALPCIHNLTNGLSAVKVRRLVGVLDSVTGQVLQRMERRQETFEQAKQAVAEIYNGGTRDLDLELSGKETLFRLVILRLAAFGVATQAAKVRYRGIGIITPSDSRFGLRFGYRIKLVGEATPNRISVAPQLVRDDGQLGSLPGDMGGMWLDSDQGPLFFSSTASGLQPAVAGVMNDLMAIACERRPLRWRESGMHTMDPTSSSRLYYVRQPSGQSLGNGVDVIEQLHDDTQTWQASLVRSNLSRRELVERLEDVDGLVLDVFEDA